MNAKPAQTTDTVRMTATGRGRPRSTMVPACRGVFALALAFAIVIPLMMPGAGVAGTWADIGSYLLHPIQTIKHMRNIGNGVRELTRERQAMYTLAQNASDLMSSYKKTQKNVFDFGSWFDVAGKGATVMGTYNQLMPKVNPVLQRIQPDLNYFSRLSNAMGSSKNGNIADSLTENRIKWLARGAGWTRVWDAIKAKPSDLFRWGKLAAEYKEGRAEGVYALRCVQLAADVNSVTKGAQSGFGGVMNGLNVLSSGRIQKRFDQLNAAQVAFVQAHKEYVQKYGAPAPQPTLATAQAPQSTVARPPTVSNTSATRNTGAWVGIQQANEAYATAYREYVRCTSDPSCAPARVNAALAALERARAQLETARGGH